MDHRTYTAEMSQLVLRAPPSRMPSMSFVSTPLGTSTSLFTRNRNGCSPCSQYLYACAAHRRAHDDAWHAMRVIARLYGRRFC